MTQGSVFSVPRLPKPVRRVAELVREVLPEGRPLPDDTWKAHYAVILVVLWFHLPVILVGAAYTGREFAAGALAVAPVAAVAAVASPPVWGRRVAATLATLGLVTASAVLVHLTDGAIETHFHFFVVVALASSYHDWTPLLGAIGFVAAEHGIVGVIAPHSVYDHSDAVMHTWRWAAIHAMFITLAAAASLLGWRVTEKAQDAERQLMDRVSDLATRDELTGLANRRFLHAKIDELANERASRVGIDDDETFSLILLDIDDFKVINDSLGHVAGDALLVSAGERLVRVIGAAGMVARLGGDEFAVLVWRGGKRAATRLAERIVAVFHDEFVIAGGPVRRHASLGVAVAGRGSSASVLLRDADLAMYAAKAAGKGMVAVYSTEMLATVQQRLQLENHLRHALDRGEMSVHYQPVVEAASGEVIAVEALMRWTHPSWGEVLPSTFIPVAESSGVISQLGEWVLRRACTDVLALSADRSKPLRVAVNVSVRQLQDSRFADLVRSVLEETGLPGADLTIEVTESLGITEDLDTTRTLAELDDLGIKLSLDDFGTGHSSLARLRTLPFSELKIDRSFTAEIQDDGECGPIITAILAMARALGLNVIAEGVERAGQAAALKRIGCDAMQGFLFGHPVPVHELRHRVSEWGTSERPLAMRGPRIRNLLDQLNATNSADGEGLGYLVRAALAELVEHNGLATMYLTQVDLAAGTQQVVCAHWESSLVPEELLVDWEDTLCRRALSSGPLYTTDVVRSFPGNAVAASVSLRTFITAPLRSSDGELQGTLCGASCALVPLDADVRALFAALANIFEDHLAVLFKELRPIRLGRGARPANGQSDWAGAVGAAISHSVSLPK